MTRVVGAGLFSNPSRPGIIATWRRPDPRRWPRMLRGLGGLARASHRALRSTPGLIRYERIAVHDITRGHSLIARAIHQLVSVPRPAWRCAAAVRDRHFLPARPGSPKRAAGRLSSRWTSFRSSATRYSWCSPASIGVAPALCLDFNDDPRHSLRYEGSGSSGIPGWR